MLLQMISIAASNSFSESLPSKKQKYDNNTNYD